MRSTALKRFQEARYSSSCRHTSGIHATLPPNRMHPPTHESRLTQNASTRTYSILLQQWRHGVEEAKEILDRRNHREPTTHHLSEDILSTKGGKQPSPSGDAASKPHRSASHPSTAAGGGGGGKGKAAVSPAAASMANVSTRSKETPSGATPSPRPSPPPPSSAATTPTGAAGSGAAPRGEQRPKRRQVSDQPRPTPPSASGDAPAASSRPPRASRPSSAAATPTAGAGGDGGGAATSPTLSSARIRAQNAAAAAAAASQHQQLLVSPPSSMSPSPLAAESGHIEGVTGAAPKTDPWRSPLVGPLSNDPAERTPPTAPETGRFFATYGE